MTVPPLPQPSLFPPEYATPIDPKHQVDRWPGITAPCTCGKPVCQWPFEKECWPETPSKETT